MVESQPIAFDITSSDQSASTGGGDVTVQDITDSGWDSSTSILIVSDGGRLLLTSLVPPTIEPAAEDDEEEEAVVADVISTSLTSTEWPSVVATVDGLAESATSRSSPQADESAEVSTRAESAADDDRRSEDAVADGRRSADAVADAVAGDVIGERISAANGRKRSTS